jgi:hypothetical protein
VKNRLHVVSFNIPYPPNYGGVIDVYYKIKALSEAGIKIHLHCFEYGRQAAKELELICESVNYYHRKMRKRDLSKLLPYTVLSRTSDELLENLVKDDSPILFEGLHTCYYLDDKKLAERKKLVRLHYVEWDYYRHLGKSERRTFRKFYYYTESLKLKYFENILQLADKILPISFSDFESLKKKFSRLVYLPPFHSNERVSCIPGKGMYALYHGNLDVPENNQVAMFLVNKVFNDLQIPFIIAGSLPSEMLKKEIKKFPHIQLRADLKEEEMIRLIRHAHINVLPTFQDTGVKQKLLNSLFNGRYVITNSKMVKNTGLDSLCLIRDSADEMKSALNEYMDKDFEMEQVNSRRSVLMNSYSNQSNAVAFKELLQS